MAWDMIAISKILLVNEEVFNSARRLVISLCNCLKKDIIEISKYLGIWYK